MLSADHRRAWCAWADCLTERQASGWELVRGPAVFEAIRRCAAARYRGHSLTDTQQVMRDRVRKAPPVEMRPPAFVHPGTPIAWLVVHVMPDRNLRAWLDHLPDLRLFAPLQLEVVSGNPFDYDRVQRDIERWARSRRIEIAMHWPAHFASHPHPLDAAATGQDLYQQHLGKSVLALREGPIKPYTLPPYVYGK